MNKMPHDVEEMLNKIRSDIKDIKPSESIYEKPFRDLIANLDARDALKVGLKQIGSYLPSYEKYYPDVTWVREWLEKAEMLEVTRPVGFNPYGEGVDDTGPFSFIVAIGNLDFAIQFYLRNDDTTSKRFVFSVIAGVATAKWITFWVEDDPESWKLTRQEATDEKISRRIRRYRNGSRFKEYEKSIWLSLLDDIEQISYSN